MKWSELLERIETARKNWEIIKFDLGDEKEAQAVFKDSYLVLTNDFSRAGLTNFAGEVQRGEIIKYKFLKDTLYNKEYISLSQALRDCQSQIKGLFPGTAEYKKAKKPLDEAEKKLKTIDFSLLEFADDINIEPRFSTMNIEVIQKIKIHSLVDVEKTCKSKSSIKVVLQSSPRK